MDDLTKSFPIVGNRYQIIRTKGSGGTSIVYEAQDLVLERKIALKILKRELTRDQSLQNRFRHEAKSTANLNHPNIVSTYDFGLDQDRLYLVLEYVEGEDLKTWLQNRDEIDLRESQKLIKQILKGISYAHDKGIIHCDLKPQNLLINSDGVLKVSDFGIARAFDQISVDERSAEVWGSPLYISPEQSRGEAPAPQSDVYAIGVIAYELITGVLPFHSDDVSKLLKMHRMNTPKPPRDLNNEISKELNDLILASLEKSLEKRPATGKEFLENLEKIEEQILVLDKKQSNAEAQVKTKEVQRMDFASILLSLAVLIVAGGLIPFWIYILFSLNIF